MADFSLDTSGFVIRADAASLSPPDLTMWKDLDPFTQGYVEALLREVFEFATHADGRPYGFSDLAPETLARIMDDCAKFVELFGLCEFERPETYGHVFWGQRQSGDWTLDPYRAAFPPLTPYLGDDGRVYLRETA